jgi:predicted glycogen debranching enzyme
MSDPQPLTPNPQPPTPDTREWLSTNGLGGYASGTVCGANTRRYHGLLVAALNPPSQRTVLLSRIDETVVRDAQRYELAVNFWASGDVAPQGHRHLASFGLDPVPTWEYSLPPGRLIKRVAAIPGRIAVAISYRLEGGTPVRLELRLLANDRDYHGDTHGHPDWQFIQSARSGGVDVQAFDGATPWSLRWSDEPEVDVQYRPVGAWYWGYLYPEEAARGLAPTEDAYCLGALDCELGPGQSIHLVASLDPLAPPGMERIVEAIEQRADALLTRSGLPKTEEAAALVRAADQFVVRRASTDGPTVIAGYHWFADWGRDTMIALPGLTISTRRFDDAAGLLRTFARYVDRGMLPNRFPDYEGEPPEYNTVDATLWWFHALEAYFRATDDLELVREQFPVLADVVDWHERGTRHGIRVDPADGLLLAGEPGVQLTWMDAKVGDWVVTPRRGKPIEINALWLNALEVMADFGQRLGQDPGHFRRLADRARAAMPKFWDEARGYLADVIAPDGTPDASLRPNQLIALALPHSAFDRAIAARVLAVVERELLTPVGLRTLDRRHADFRPLYGGDAAGRDGAYHQGTIWPWLLGPYADALVRVNGHTPETRERLRELIRPLLRHVAAEGCLGSVNEIFEAQPPHGPRGCVAQAWSVSELLRVHALAAQPLERGRTAALAGQGTAAVRRA